MHIKSSLQVFFGLLIVVVSACGGGGDKPPVTPETPTPGATSTATATPVASATAPAEPPPPAADPTALTDDQKKRDLAIAPQAAAIVEAYANDHAWPSYDGKRVVFRSNRDGAWQAYVSDPEKPAAEAKKLTSGAERVTSPRFTPDGKYILFLSDTGADENFAIWRMTPDGAGLTNVTPAPKLHRDAPFVPRLKPSLLVYSAHDNHESKTHVFVQNIEGGDAKEVYVDPQPAFVVAVSPDGGRALLVRAISLSNSVLFEVDLDAGQAKRIYPPEARIVNINTGAYSADGRRILLATDDGTESSYVLLVEPGSNTVSARYQETTPPTAMTDDLAVSDADDRVAVLVDEGNRSEVRLLDAHTLKLQGTVKAPLGFAELGMFSGDGKYLTMFESTPDAPFDIWRVDAETGVARPLRAEKRPTLAALPPLTATIDKAQAFDGKPIPLNVYLPKKRTGKLPTLVIVHGGPAGSYKVRWSMFARFFTAQGYAVVEPNIRGSTGFGRAYEMADNREKRGDALKDLESVNAWVKAQAWCEADRVVVLGGSYGGYMTLMALTRQPTLWRAGVDLFGIYDLKTFMRSTNQLIRALFVDEFGDLDRDGDLLDAYSPKRDVDKIAAPLFVYAGANDPRVPRSESDQIVNALRSRKVPVEYMVAANEGHSIDRKDNQVELMTRVARFLGDQLKVAAPASAPPPKKK